jgi:aminoglycoside 6'-N-acetyltransferase I
LGETRDTLTVRPAEPADAHAWLRLRLALWPEEGEAEHRAEIDRFLSLRERAGWQVLLALDGSGAVVGFAELSVRPCAEGCRTDRVAYLEGWHVTPEARRRGFGRALVRAAEAWGRALGCRELASDADPANRGGVAAHRAVGFAEAGLVLCFRKDL